MNHDPTLALAFLNTRAPAGGGPDVWTAPEDVRDWLVASGLVPEEEALSRLTPPESRLLLDDARRLRRALEELVVGWTTAGSPPPGMALLELNRLLEARARRRISLVHRAGGYEIHDHVPPTSVSAFLAQVAESGALLLAREDPSRVRRCAAPGCSRWFLDTSKNQQRRWCSMAVCGNRAKVAAHHRRRKRAQG